MAIPIPSLTSAGWVTSLPEKADSAVAYYFTSDKSQSRDTFGNNVTTLAQQIQQYGNDELSLTTFVTEQLQAYLSRYFDTVTVNVSTDIPSPIDPSRLNLTVGVIVTDDGKAYSLGRLIETLNGKVSKIIDINNFPSAGTP